MHVSHIILLICFQLCISIVQNTILRHLPHCWQMISFYCRYMWLMSPVGVLPVWGFAWHDAFEGRFITTEGKLNFCNAFLSNFPDLELVSCGLVWQKQSNADWWHKWPLVKKLTEDFKTGTQVVVLSAIWCERFYYWAHPSMFTVAKTEYFSF